MDEKRDKVEKRVADEDLDKVAGGVQDENSIWLNSSKPNNMKNSIWLNSSDTSNGTDGDNEAESNIWIP